MANKKAFNVLITSVSGKIPLVREVRKALEKFAPGSQIVAGDSDGGCIGRYFSDTFWEMPPLENLRVEVLIKYCRDHQLSAIIPTRDGELVFFAELKALMKAGGISILVPSADGVRTCLDKLLFYEAFKDHPKVAAIHTAAEPDDRRSMRWVVKERFGAGSRRIRLDLTTEEAKSAGSQMNCPVFQPYIEGWEYSVDMYIDESGQTVGSVARSRDRVVDGESRVTTTSIQPGVETVCSTAAGVLQLTGHLIFQVIVDGDGCIHLVECNPRFGGASSLSIAAGLDSFYWFFLESADECLPPNAFERQSHRLRQVRYPEDKIIQVDKPHHGRKLDSTQSEISAVRIGNYQIGPGHPVFIVAELSANHRQNFDEAVRLVETARAAGADAVKLQTYTPDTMTIKHNGNAFQHGKGSLWAGQSLYELYEKAYMPWDWQPRLQKIAADCGLVLFSSVYDPSSIEFLQRLDLPAYKISSFELVDLPLIRLAAKTGKPLVLSTGMAALDEIRQAVETARSAGASEIILLKCTSAYPADAAGMNLATIPHLARTFNLPCGFSDHSNDNVAAITAVALGACMIEKHFRLEGGREHIDGEFSLTPGQFSEMVESVRAAEKAAGDIVYGSHPSENQSLAFRRSLYAVADIEGGQKFTRTNVRSIRPSGGLFPDRITEVLGQKVSRPIKKRHPNNPGTFDIDQTLKHIKGIVFDLDDTLYPQASFKRSGFRVVAGWVAKHYSFNAATILNELEDIMQQKGASYPFMFNDLVNRLNIDRKDILEMVAAFIEHEPTISCYSKVHETLACLRKRYKLGLLTDGRLGVQQRKIKALELAPYFDKILCSDSMGLEKPATELYEWFERNFQMMGRELMYVGNDPSKDFFGANVRDWTTVQLLTSENKTVECEPTFSASFETSSLDDFEKLLT